MGRGRKPDEWYKSEECERVVELAKEGYSEGRIAEIVGIKKSRVMYAKRLFGIKGARGFTTSGIVYNDNLLARHEHSNLGNERRKQESESQLAFLLLDKGLLYISGYDGRGSKVKVCCTVCGTTFTKHYDGHFKNRKTLECPFCEEQRLESKRQIKAERHQAYLELLNERKSNREAKERAKERADNERLDAKQICKCCGKEFTLREYRTKEQTEHCEYTVYCSSECRKEAERKYRRKHNVTHGKHKLRAIKYGVEFDKTVNLDDMLIRFGTKCALCGGECDQNDYQIINGVYVYGDNYPSIDHIIPLCKRIKGHTWDNVQVAHRGCNTKKGANIVA